MRQFSSATAPLFIMVAKTVAGLPSSTEREPGSTAAKSTVGPLAAGTVTVFASAETVPPKARALPLKLARCPNEMPAASMIVPTPVALAPKVVAESGAQKTLPAAAPLVRLMAALAPMPSAPPDLKM